MYPRNRLLIHQKRLGISLSTTSKSNYLIIYFTSYYIPSNASDVDKTVDIYRYVECTSAAIQGLKQFKRLYPGYRKKEIEACTKKAIDFIESIQLSDGSW